MEILDIVIKMGPSLLAGATGIGIGWATLKERLFSLEKGVDKELKHIANRVSKTEGKLEAQVGEARCLNFRQACQSDIMSEIQDIKLQVRENRTVVMNKVDDLMRFVGRVEQFMAMLKQNGGKL